MIARFNTEDSTRDYFAYVRKHALILIAFGVVMLVAGLAAGISTLFLVEGAAGGALILVAGLLCGAILIVYGMYGLKKQLLSNTLITALDENMTIFDEDKMVILQAGRGIKTEKHYDYMHVARVIEDDNAYYIELKDNTLVLCAKASLLEGNLSDLTKLFRSTFGKNFLSRVKLKGLEVNRADKALKHESVAAIDEPNNSDKDTDVVIEVSSEDIEIKEDIKDKEVKPE